MWKYYVVIINAEHAAKASQMDGFSVLDTHANTKLKRVHDI